MKGGGKGAPKTERRIVLAFSTGQQLSALSADDINYVCNQASTISHGSRGDYETLSMLVHIAL